MVTLNREQDAAVAMAKRLRETRGIGVFSGPAGTGKTTTIEAILDTVGKALVVAPTGRAVIRAKEVTKGKAAEARTCHSWLYLAIENQTTGRVVFHERPRNPDTPGGIFRPEANLVIVEESSMLGRELNDAVVRAAKDLGLGILYVGDHYQLPPVAGTHEEAFSIFDPSFPADERVTLDEVFRQALDSPVLRVATNLRTGSWRDVKRILRELPVCADVVGDTAEASWRHVDAITLAHRNETRLRLNRLVRHALGISPFGPPEVGEPLIVRRNSKAGVYNGEIIPFPGWMAPPGADGLGVAKLPNGAKVLLFPVEINGGKEPQRYVMTRKEQSTAATYLKCQYGYVITCHASQGGQWDEVVLVLEPSLRVMPEAERMRWLYTAVSRAKKTCYLGSAPKGRSGEEA